MAIDMTEVRQLFFEESLENLDIMESNLLDLGIGAVDRELVNSIFRAAHSIKGGAGIFKFEEIIHFAHVAETLLDEMRRGEHLVTQPIIDVLLRAVDVMRMLLTALKENTDYDAQIVIESQNQLTSFLKTPMEGGTVGGMLPSKSTPPATPALPPEAQSAVKKNQLGGSSATIETVPAAGTAEEEKEADSNREAAGEGWQIDFKPHPGMLKTGNDPINLFRELANLGALEVKANIDQLPAFRDIDPQICYIRWELTLHTNAPRTSIEEIFEWVESDCDLHIRPLQLPEYARITEELSKPESNATVEPVWEDTAAAPANRSPSTPTSSIPKEVASREVTQVATATLPKQAPATLPELTSSTLSELAPESVINITPSAPQRASPNVPLTQVPDNTLPAPSAPPEATLESLHGQDLHSHPRTPGSTPPGEANSIRVSIDKIDHLINLVGELVITQSMLDQVGEHFDQSRLSQLRDGLAQLERNTRELQESVMRIRMLPISYSFNRFPRLVHDLSVQLGKKVELKLSGVHTELDKTVLEKMSDPLVHLVRNALDHGIETSEKRRQAGKPETGLLHLHAYHQGGNIIIQISDDGAGFDLDKIRAKAVKQGLLSKDDLLTDEQQLHEMVFLPGFSTAEQVNDLSGRGVGMDVVRRNIRSLGGMIDIQSKKNQGTTFRIRLPLTLAILDGQLVRVGQEIYILSLLSIIESLRIKPQLVNSLAGKAEVYRLRDEYVPILRLYELFDIIPSTSQLDQGLLVIVEGDGQKIGLFVDELLSQQQIVIKSLDSNFKKIQGISGATILGDGSVALILDIAGLIQWFHHGRKKPAVGGIF